MKNEKKIGIYGGTFSPVHNGHIGAALSFLRKEKLDKLYIIPTGVPPHKDIYPEDNSENRYKMLEIAFSSYPEYGKKIFISDFEITRPGKSYTYNTLMHFMEESDRLCLLCGTDMFLTLDTWYRAEDIFKMADIICVRRENDRDTGFEITKKAEEYIHDYSAVIRMLELEPFEISSHRIREMICTGNDPQGYLPRDVYDYIKERRLYLEK